MPSHRKRYVDVMPSWPYDPRVPVQPELPGVSRVVRTPGQSGSIGEAPTSPAPDDVNAEVAV